MDKDKSQKINYDEKAHLVQGNVVKPLPKSSSGARSS